MTPSTKPQPDPKLTEFDSDELITEIMVRGDQKKLIEDADSQDMVGELTTRGDLPDCTDLHVDDATYEQLEEAMVGDYRRDDITFGLQLLGEAIESQNWAKVKEAATKMGAEFVDLSKCGTNKNRCSEAELRDAIKHNHDREFLPRRAES